MTERQMYTGVCLTGTAIAFDILLYINFESLCLSLVGCNIVMTMERALNGYNFSPINTLYMDLYSSFLPVRTSG